MVSNRRNLIFRVSIVINVALLFYAAMHLSGTPAPSIEWVPLTADGSDKSIDYRYLVSSNETDTKAAESLVKNTAETLSQTTLRAILSTNRTASSTTSVASVALPSEPDATNETALEINDENGLTDATLARLRNVLDCNDRDFYPETEQRGEFWILKNYIRADHGRIQCHETVTYTTHAGFEFLDNVQPLVERWLAPISLAIHAPGSDFNSAVDSIRYLRECAGNDLVRSYVTFHIFFPNKHVPSKIPDPDTFLNEQYNCSRKPPYLVDTNSTYLKQKSLLYPVNVARNVARDAALTHYMLPSDIELYPSPNLPPRFLNMIARNEAPLNNSSNRRIFPISIFEVDAKVQVPSTKTELQTMLTKKKAIPFHKYVCPNCHNIPMGPQWIKAKETDRMGVFHVGKRRGKYVHWEPIFIGTHQDPHYDERLSWEGKQDKMTQGYILCVMDYDFMILNNAFLIHKPGIKHYVKNPKRDTIAGRQGTFINKVIMPELKKLFGTRNGCAL